MTPLGASAIAFVSTGLLLGGGMVVIHAVNAPPISGMVVHKDHRDQYMTCTGKPLVCSNHPEKWELSIRTPDGHTHERDVHQSTYEGKHVGDRFTEVK